MVDCPVEELEAGRVLRYRPRDTDRSLSCAEALARLRDDAEFRRSFSTLLADAPFAAYFWELPALTPRSRAAPFEFILADAPTLAASHPQPRAFEQHLQVDSKPVEIACFSNLGRDAILIAPGELGSRSSYTHLAAFLRTGPEPQVDALWREVGRATLDALGQTPLWLSTAGLGVAWLHVRLDEIPKYITHRPYRRAC